MDKCEYWATCEQEKRTNLCLGNYSHCLVYGKKEVLSQNSQAPLGIGAIVLPPEELKKPTKLEELDNGGLQL